MPKRAPPAPPTRIAQLEAEVKQLERDLFKAHYSIIQMAPESMKRCLTAHFYVESFADLDDWRRWASERIVQQADLVAIEIPHFSQRRANCPLCGKGSSAPYDEGYALPVGLERHLLGTHRSHICPVFGAADHQAILRAREFDRGEGRRPGGEPRIPPWKVPDPPAPPARTPPSAAILSFPVPKSG